MCGYAVGSSKTTSVQVPLLERLDGSKWSVQRIPIPAGSKYSGLGGVSCPAENACMAVGSDESGALAERWNGSKWSLQRIPNPTSAPHRYLFGVSCIAENACVAVGGDKFGLLAARWNGQEWSVQRIPSPTGNEYTRLFGVSCSAQNACTAVGISGRTASVQVPFAERWNGSKWSPLRTAIPAGSTFSSLESVSCPAVNVCVAVGTDDHSSSTITGDSVMLAERWNGSKWVVQSTPKFTDTNLGGVSCSAQNACTAVGAHGGATLAERWNGSTWSRQSTPNPGGFPVSELGGVSCPSQNACTAVGYHDHGTGEGDIYSTLAEGWTGN